jgi:hypothetical protein
MPILSAEGVGPAGNGFSMTKDRAKKKTARARAATTGERYVVARRAVERGDEHADAQAGVLHRLTHRVPGVPEHVEGGLPRRRNKPHRDRARRPSARPHPHHGEPRVLVGWQRRIARLLHAE